MHVVKAASGKNVVQNESTRQMTKSWFENQVKIGSDSNYKSGACF